MNSRKALLEAVDELERLLRQSAELVDGLDGHRKQGIEFRRQIAEKVATIGSLGEQLFEAAEQVPFRREFSHMRSALAYHQASWPIVSIKLDDPNYRASVQSLRDANRSFISWVRRALANT